ncbi:MAG: alpha-2-macroglobulin, partial [Pricia sp.]
MLTWGPGFAQQDGSYEILWKKVRQYESDGLTQSALKAVDTISKKAKEEGNSAQTVKTLLYTSKYALILEKDAQLKIVEDFRSEIAAAEFPTKNVLESYLANLYWQYFQQHRYQFYDRTLTANKVDSTDFRTWDLTTLFHEIDAHFEASLENKDKLQKTDLGNFEPILKERPDSDTYRPTLFDLLAHEALKFYKTDENSITRPADQFEIDDTQILCEAYAFTQIDIDTKDETSLQAKTLHIYQDLIAFHFSDADMQALVDVDIERLDFIHKNAVFANRDERFIEVLQNSAENFVQSPLSALYTYEIARMLHQQGNGYQPKVGKENRWKQQEALALCESAIARFPDSRGADKCKALKSQILAPSLQLTTENYLPVDTEARLLVHYKNIETLELNALQISQNQLKELNKLYPYDKQRTFLKKLPVAKKWDASLKNEKDYQRHGIEILFPSLDNGHYVILATPGSENGTFAFSPVQVTDLALVTTRSPENYQFQVIDRHDGHPISRATVELSYRKNYDGGRLTKTLETDSQGSVDIPLSNQNWSDVRVTVTHKDEKANFGAYYVSSRYDRDEPSKVTTTAFLFTDRSIYRPSQP